MTRCDHKIPTSTSLLYIHTTCLANIRKAISEDKLTDTHRLLLDVLCVSLHVSQTEVEIRQQIKDLEERLTTLECEKNEKTDSENKGENKNKVTSVKVKKEKSTTNVSQKPYDSIINTGWMERIDQGLSSV